LTRLNLVLLGEKIELAWLALAELGFVDYF
jgi:hypothetical protein